MKKKIIFYLITITLLFSFIKVKAIEVNSYQELKDAISSKESEIVINQDFEFNSLLTIGYDVTIDGANHTLTRDNNYLKGLFSVKDGFTLTLSNLTIDSKASGWQMDIENRFYTDDTNTAYVRFPTIDSENDVIASATLISNAGNLIINNSTFNNFRCTVSGCVINGKGNNTIKNSTFDHIGSSKNGGVIYVSGGNTIISESTFKNNASGVGVTTATQGGVIYITAANLLEVKDNNIFENNIVQNNGAAIFALKTNVLIENSEFKNNKCGNDGSSISLGSTEAGHTVNIHDIVFDGNIGYATRAQSLGTIWITKWVTDENNPLIFKNLIFKNNLGVTTGLAETAASSNILMEDIESYDNKYYQGGLLYGRTSTFTLNNINVHDNECVIDSTVEKKYCDGAAFYTQTSLPISVNNLNANNNEGTAIVMLNGKYVINNSQITNNLGFRENYSGGIQVYGTDSTNMPKLEINNTTITNNEALRYGGGLSIIDNENVFTSLKVDDQSKIYDNKAALAGDDFLYSRQNKSVNETENTISLCNIGSAGIEGIDGWYNDGSVRYVDAEEPSKFDNYVDYKGYAKYLKAGGVKKLDYDLVEGTNDDIIPVTIKYGVPYTVTDEEPEKEGFIFKNWNTKEDGSGTTLTSGDTYDGSEGYILYAIYEETNYTVNYDLQGGNNEKIVSVTNPYTKEFNVTSEVPEKVGYKFIEWNTKSDGTGISLDANEVYDRSDGFTLYAIYEETEYTINYDLVGGTNEKIVSVTNPYTKEFNVTSEVPEKVGFIFKNWNTKADGTGISLNANEVYDRSDGFTLYAIYEETEYTINYDLQGGSNEKIVSVTNLYTKEFNVTSEVPEKDGFKFIEWNTKSDGSGISLNADEVYDRSDGFTLYAIYEKIEEERVPITGDNINTSIIMLILSSLLFTSCIFIKKYNR